MEKIIINDEKIIKKNDIDSIIKNENEFIIVENEINYVINEKLANLNELNEKNILKINKYYFLKNKIKNKIVIDCKILDKKEKKEKIFLKTNETKESKVLNKKIITKKVVIDEFKVKKLNKDKLFLKNPKESFYINWENIYLNLKRYENNQKISNNKMLQKKIDSIFEENKRALYITKTKQESIDLKTLSFFQTSNLEDFIYLKKDHFTIKEKELIIYEKEKFSLKETKEKYDTFIKEIWLKKLENQELNYEEFIKKINDEISKKFKKIANISRQAQKNLIETGNWTTYIGWPFAIGKINENYIRAPIAYFPIRIEKWTNNEYKLTHLDRPIKINAQLVKCIYSSQRKDVNELKIDFDNIDEILQEYWKHGLKFDNQLNVLENLKKIKKEDFKNLKIRKLEIKNIFYIENKIFHAYIWNDSKSIIRNFNNFNWPKENKKLFSENENLKYKNNLFLNIDKNKSNVISKALDDSIVIQGPPGTGKSETITGILSLLATKGKSSILVSEKNAALSVVVERLSNNYDLSNFFLKLNGDGLSKEKFWKKIKKNIMEIQIDISNKEKKLKNNNEDFLQILKNNNEIIGKIKTSNIEISDFWNYLTLYIKYEKIFNNDKISFENKYKEYIKNINFKDENEILIIEKQKENKEIEIEYINLKNNLLKNKEKINLILKPTFCNLIKDNIDFKFLEKSTDDFKMFKYLSNKHYSFFKIRNEFKKNRKKIIQLKELLFEKNKIKYKIKNIDFNKIDINNKKITKLKNQNEKIINLYKLNDEVIRKKINEFDNFAKEYKNNFFKLEKIFLESIKNEKNFHLNEKYQLIKKEIYKLYEENKKTIKNNLIKEIRLKIQKNEKLKNEYINLRTLSNNNKKVNSEIIFKKYFNIIKTLFPFILSTPNEVSKYIPHDPNIFEYGIFDEASQMLKERAFPTIHRSKKIIVAGDKKQLGPSNLFRTQATEDDEELINITDASLLSDSLLSWAESKYANVILNYHYRSLSSKLIEYSNANFYDSKLIVSDSPNGENKPIEYIDLKGQYDINNINILEAKKAIEILKENINNYKNIGVITMNKKQQDYIWELINKESDLYKLFNENKIFIKNIENVQGDEADLIIFSLQYSTNNNQKSIIVWNGLTENRLNVSITRARKKMIIIKSFNSIDLGRGNLGTAKNTLFKWIKWLENEKNKIDKNELAHIWNNEDKSKSPFETEFIELIKLKIPNNIKILNNFKISQYEIDVVLFDKEKNKYLALIELDGWQFHNSTKQINMDYEKTIFLEDLGWEIRRISSKEFYRNKEECIQEVLFWLSKLNILKLPNKIKKVFS